MADHYPITFQTVSARDIERFYGRNIGPFLRLSVPAGSTASLITDDANVPAGAVLRSYRRVQVFTRGGALQQAFSQLVSGSGISSLAFLGGVEATHEVLNKSDWRGKVRYTVIRESFDEYVEAVQRLIEWYRDNPDTIDDLVMEEGQDLDGRYFVDVRDVIESVEYSLDPNDDYCERDGFDPALVVSTLRTLIWLLRKAKGSGHWLVCEA